MFDVEKLGCGCHTTVLCIVISPAIYQLYFASNSSAIIVVPTPISRSVMVSPCILHCSSNQK